MKHLSKKIIMLVAALLNLGAIQANIPMAQAGLSRYAPMQAVMPKISMTSLVAMRLTAPQFSALLTFKAMNVPSAGQVLQMSPVKNLNELLSNYARLCGGSGQNLQSVPTGFEQLIEKIRAFQMSSWEQYLAAEIGIDTAAIDVSQKKAVVTHQHIEQKQPYIEPTPFLATDDSFLRECNIRLGLRLVYKEDIAQLSYEHQASIIAVIYAKLMDTEDKTPFKEMVHYIVTCNKIAEYHPELDKLFIKHKDYPNIVEFTAHFKKLAQEKALPQELQSRFAQTEEKAAKMSRIEWGTFCWKLSKKF